MGYYGYYFQSFSVVNVRTTTDPGILPHSPQNYAGTGVVGEMAAGSPMITVNYQNSNVTNFDFKVRRPPETPLDFLRGTSD